MSAGGACACASKVQKNGFVSLVIRLVWAMTLAVIPVYWDSAQKFSEVKQPRARVALGWVRLGNGVTRPYQPSRTERGE